MLVKLLLLQAVDAKQVSNCRLFTLFFLGARNFLNAFLSTFFFLQKLFFASSDSHSLVYSQPMQKMLLDGLMAYSQFKAVSVAHGILRTLFRQQLCCVQLCPRLCAFGLDKQFGLAKDRYCVGWMVCSLLLMLGVMFCWPKLCMNCFICSVLQFNDELLLVLSSYLWFVILVFKPVLKVFIASH